MSTTISDDELANSLENVLDRVRSRQEHFVIRQNGESIAELVPVARGVMLHDILELLGDLRMPDDGFADDLEAIQSSQQPAEFPEWPS